MQFLKIEKYKNLQKYIESFSQKKMNLVTLVSRAGLGKCVAMSKNDYIITENGEMTKISKKMVENNTLCFNNKKGLQYSPIKKYFKRQVNKTLSLKLEDGRQIRLTPEHPLLTISGWQPVSELKIGDFICVPNVYPIIKHKNKISNSLNKILGHLIAEGGLTGHYPMFSSGDKESVKDIKYQIKRFNKKLTLKQDKTNHYTYRIVKKTNKGKRCPNPLKVELKRLGLYGKLSKDKFFPNEVLSQNNQRIADCLSRYMDGDGCVANNIIEVTSASEFLIKQLKHLFLRFGVHSQISNKKAKNYPDNSYFRLVITDRESLAKYHKHIKFNLTRKQDRLTKIVKSKKAINTNKDVIPLSEKKFQELTYLTKTHWNTLKLHCKTGNLSRNKVKRLLDLFKNFSEDDINVSIYGMSKFSNKTYASVLNVYRNQKNVSSNTISKILKLEKKLRLQKFKKAIHLLSELKWQSKDNIRWVKIKEKHLINEPIQVYDLEIDNSAHNFLVNDIIIHNSFQVENALIEFAPLTINSHVTPMRFYQLIYERTQEEKDVLVMIDEAEIMFSNSKLVTMLKILCDSREEKVMQYSTTSPLFKDYPREFETKAKVILLLNKLKPEDPNIRAVMSRGHCLNFCPSDIEIHRYLTEWAEDKEILGFLKTFAPFSKNLNLRTYVLAIESKQSNIDWRYEVIQNLEIDERLFLIKDLLEKHTDDIKRLEKWTESRASFYRWKKLFLSKTK